MARGQQDIAHAGVDRELTPFSGVIGFNLLGTNISFPILLFGNPLAVQDPLATAPASRQGIVLSQERFTQIVAINPLTKLMIDRCEKKKSDKVLTLSVIRCT